MSRCTLCEEHGYECYTEGYVDSQEQRIRELEAENTKLRERVKRYGRHHLTCDRGHIADNLCTCGLAALLKEEE